MTSPFRTFIRRGGWACACALAVAGFYDARELNSGYALPAHGVLSVPESEQVFYLWYAICGTLAVISLSKLCTEFGLAGLLRKGCEEALARPGAWVSCISMLVFAASYAVRSAVLLGHPITDDEGTYLFIARTLLAGRLTNPVPEDADFFRNQFIVINEHGWHGKYPIGHPLVLALGEGLGAVGLVMPCVAALIVLLTYRVGRQLFDERIAVAGATLLLVSPHFVWTSATLLSQPTLGLAMLAGSLALLRTTRIGWTAVLAGCCFGFGILVRPLPGVLFCAVAAVQLVRAERIRGGSIGRMLGQAAAFGAGVVPWILLFGVVNYAQSGNPFSSGYHDYHGGLKVLYNDKGQVVNSVVGGLLRENFWLLGWTFALLLLPWTRPVRGHVLFWGLLLSELAYRVIAPKTVVSATGPIYLTEVVPLLTLACADALARIGRYFREHPVRPSVVAVAATLIGASMFAPIQLSALAAGAEARAVVYTLLEHAGAERALIFANAAVYPESSVTWAYFPDNPSPKLDDRWLFVRVPRTNDIHPRMIEFWQRHFPERRAFVFAPTRDGPRFDELAPP